MFCVGDFVFAKMRGSPAWPAVVRKVIREKSGNTIKKIFEVYFYGTRQIGFVREIDLFTYEENLETLRCGSKRNSFLLALKEIEEQRSACYETSYTSNINTEVKDCTVVLERTLLEKKSQMNVPGDHTCIIDDNVHLLHGSVNNRAETQDCSDIECHTIESPKRLFSNGKFQDSGNKCALIGEESPNLECRSSTDRENSTNCPSQSAVHRLFQEKPEQQMQENSLYTNSCASGSRQSSVVINCSVNPSLFIESDEADSSENMATNARHSPSSSLEPVVKEENMSEVEWLREIHGSKRGHEYEDSDFHDLPTPPRPDSISIPCEKMFDNCLARKSLEGLLETPNICDISTPKDPRSASKFCSKPLKNSDSKVPDTELKNKCQKLQDVKLHDLPTPKCDNDSVKFKYNLMDTCPQSPVASVGENLQEFRSGEPVKENAKASIFRTNCSKKTEVIRNGVVEIIARDNLTQIGQCSISRFEDSSTESEEHSSESKNSVLVLGCGKNGLSLSSVSAEPRREAYEGRSFICLQPGNSLVRSSQGSDGISNSNSEPLEIDLISDSSDDENLSPFPKRIEYDSRQKDSVSNDLETLRRAQSNDREALLTFSRARWKSRREKRTAVKTESSVTEQSHDLNELVQDHPSLKPAAPNKDLLPRGYPSKSKTITVRGSKFASASESQIPTLKENTLIHQSKQILNSETFSPVSNQKNIALSVSSTTTGKERCVAQCISPQSNIVGGHLNEISRAASGTRNPSMPVSFQSCDGRVGENDITQTAHDRDTHFVSHLRLPKRQLGSKSSYVEATLFLCNSTGSQKCEKDRPVLSNSSNQDQSSVCYCVNQPNSQSRNEVSLVFEVDSSVCSRYPTSPEISLNEVINHRPDHEDTALYSMKCLTHPKDKITSHQLTNGVPSQRSSRDVSLTAEQSSLTHIPGQFSVLSPTHQQDETSNSSFTTEKNSGINSSVIDSSISVVRELSVPLPGERNPQPSKEKKERNVATNLGSIAGCRIDSTSKSRNESADKSRKRTTAASSLNDYILSKYPDILKRSPVVLIRRLDNATIQAILKYGYSSWKQNSENLTDGSKKRKKCPPKKLHSVGIYSNSSSSYDMQKTPDKLPNSEIDKSAVTCETINAVAVRPKASEAKINHQLLRRKMFSVVRGNHREDVSLKSNGLMLNHQKQIPKETGESKNSISPNEAVTKEDRNFTENTKCEQIKGKRKLMRCDVCWRNVENVTEHIINDHRSMFYSPNHC